MRLNTKFSLVLLLFIYASNNVDSFALGLVMQNIKADLHLSDTQLGFLSGLAFAFFYAIVGIPIARWADVSNRCRIIAATTLLWSVAVIMCGVAQTYSQLLSIRIGVAVGESGCVPASNSLIADYFARSDRPRALGVFMLGPPLGLAIGYLLGGWVNEVYGWRTMFIVLGLPGALLALLARATLKEPRACVLVRGNPVVAPRGNDDGSARGTSNALNLSAIETFVYLWRISSFRNVLVAFSIVYFFGTGIGQWQPAFLIRRFGFETGELGAWLAAIYGVGGAIGTYWGGEWASRRAAGNESKQLKGIAFAYCAFGLISAFIYLSYSKNLTFALLALSAIGLATASGPLFSTIQTLVPAHMRATAIAVIYLFANLFGMGLGPLAVGALSDALRPAVGDESLRYALLILCPGYLWSAYHLLRASRTIEQDLPGESTEEAGRRPKELGAVHM